MVQPLNAQSFGFVTVNVIKVSLPTGRAEAKITSWNGDT